MPEWALPLFVPPSVKVEGTVKLPRFTPSTHTANVLPVLTTTYAWRAVAAFGTLTFTPPATSTDEPSFIAIRTSLSLSVVAINMPLLPVAPDDPKCMNCVSCVGDIVPTTTAVKSPSARNSL